VIAKGAKDQMVYQMTEGLIFEEYTVKQIHHDVQKVIDVLTIFCLSTEFVHVNKAIGFSYATDTKR